MSGLQDFRTFFQSFIALIAAGVATTAAVLVTALLGIAPPWPQAIVQLTAVAQLIALIFVYQQMSKAGKAIIDRSMRRALVILIVSTILYLSLYSLLVFSMPNGSTGLRGIFCTQDATLVFGEQCPLLEKSAIAKAEFEAERLWTGPGLMMSRIGILVAWVVSFAALVTLVGTFVVYQRRQRSPTRTAQADVQGFPPN